MPVDQVLNSQEAGYLARLALVALNGILLSWVLVGALHVLNPEFNPITRALSEYRHSRYGLLMVAAFMGLAVSLFALAEAFRHVAFSTQQRLGVILLAAAGVGTLVAGVFPTDNTPDGSFNTARGAIHAMAGYLLSPLVVSAMLCLSGPLNHVGDNEILQRMAQALAVLNVVTFVALLIVNTIRLGVGGIGQRIFMTLVCCWLLLTSVRILLVANASI